MNKIMLTGASGFIGSRLFVFFKKSNFSLVPLTNTSSIRGTFAYDLVSDEIPSNLFNNVSTLIHLAGMAHNSGKTKSKLYKDINYEATMKLAKKAEKAGVKHFIFVSSSKANTPFDSSNNASCDTYSSSKRMAEIELTDYFNLSEMQVSIIRPSLVYGPNVKGNMKSMLKAIDSGWFPSLPKLENMKSMIHVDDVARAIALVASENNVHGRVFGLSDGKVYSTDKIYHTLSRVLQAKEPSWQISKRLLLFLSSLNFYPGKVIRKILEDDLIDNSEITKLGFMPKFSLENLNEEIF